MQSDAHQCKPKHANTCPCDTAPTSCCLRILLAGWLTAGAQPFTARGLLLQHVVQVPAKCRHVKHVVRICKGLHQHNHIRG